MTFTPALAIGGFLRSIAENSVAALVDRLECRRSRTFSRGTAIEERTAMMELLAAIEATPFATWLRESPSIWAYPTILTLHTVGLGLLVGPSWALDLRLLGAAPAIPLRAMEKTFPVMWAGFWINGLSGAVLFMTEATTKGATPLFATKLGLIAVAVATLIATRRVVFQRAAEPVIGPAARGLALLSIVLWIAAIGTGRWMAYV